MEGKYSVELFKPGGDHNETFFTGEKAPARRQSGQSLATMHSSQTTGADQMNLL
jgi:hypothetical protein